MKFYLKPGMTFTDTRISFKDLTAHYPLSQGVGVSETLVDDAVSWLNYSGGEAILHYSLLKAGNGFYFIVDSRWAKSYEPSYESFACRKIYI